MTPEEKEELNELRRLQLNASEQEFKPYKERFLALSGKETQYLDKPLTEAERTQYMELTRQQSRGENWTPEDAKRLQELQQRIDRRRK